MLLKMYTDGACSSNPGPGGYSAIICCKDKIIKQSGFENNTTNNRMELMGVIKGIDKVLELIYQECLPINIIEINSDSAYVVNAINQDWINVWKKNKFKTTQNNDVKNVDLWKALDKQIEELDFINVKLKFVKVKGHNGNYFNEMADKIAKNEIKENK